MHHTDTHIEDSFAYDIYISYAEADHEWVIGYLIDAFDAAGVRYLSEEAFHLGAPRLAEFERAIQQSARVLLVCSPAYMVDDVNQFVNLLAQSYGHDSAIWPVIPLILQPVVLPPRLAILVALDATNPDDWSRKLDLLLLQLKSRLPAPSAKPVCPYPGMKPFRELDRHHFYGRTEEIQNLLHRLYKHPFIAVIGPSGSGKSSLVFAGLLPALRKSSLWGTGEWTIRDMRPGEQPLANLAAALGDVIDLQAPVRLNVERLLLVIDQFEEVFASGTASADSFQQRVQQLLGVPNFYFVITVRADFFEDLMQSPLWPEIQSYRFEVLPLGEEGLQQAIVQPAESVGVYVEATLVERLLADAAGEPGGLPLVQETLVLLWDRLERRFLPLRAYESLIILSRKAYDRMGQARLTGLQVTLAHHADTVLAGLTTEARVVARRIFLHLIQFGEGRADTRRQQLVASLKTAHIDLNLLEQTLQTLAQNRLLILSGQPNHTSRTVDLAHEALIAGWPQLQQWIDGGRNVEIFRRQLEKAAADWDRHERKASFLYRGVQLQEAGRWAIDNESEQTSTIQEFLAASQRRAYLMTAAITLVAIAIIVAISVFPIRWMRESLWKDDASSQQVSFPASEAWLGSDEDSESRAYPRHLVELPEFALDRYEVTYRQYRLCVQAERCPPPLDPASVDGLARADEQLPVVWVTAYQAATFCHWIGRRLPTEAEWERAARGTAGRRWPWGEQEPTPAHANLFIDGFLEEAPTQTVAVDDPRFAAGATPAEEGGIYHLLGNVAEWTSTPDRCTAHPYDCSEVWDGVSEVQALFVRGFGFTDQLISDEPAPITTAVPASSVHSRSDLGFRCADSLP